MQMLVVISGYVMLTLLTFAAALLMWSLARGKLDLKGLVGTEGGSLLYMILHPVNVIAAMIVLAVISLIFLAIVGLDTGNVLKSLAEHDFARGLITYLFAVGTIGLAVLLVVGAMLGGDEMANRFARGKEVLALLLGIFGTMVGFYYGSELAARERGRAALQGEMKVSPAKARQGEELIVGGLVSGGRQPLTYLVRFGSGLGSSGEHEVPGNGMVMEMISVPAGAPVGDLTLWLVVHDAARDSIRLKGSVSVTAADSSRR